jgi:hypothetical protein
MVPTLKFQMLLPPLPAHRCGTFGVLVALFSLPYLPWIYNAEGHYCLDK